MRSPKSFEDLKEQISRRYAELPGRLRQIAEFALHHPNDMAFGTVAVIADRAGVQPSTSDWGDVDVPSDGDTVTSDDVDVWSEIDDEMYEGCPG